MSLKKGLVLDLDISSEGLQGTTKFKDKTPYENNGTLSNVTLTTDHKGKANSAGLFNGINSYIDCGDDAVFNIAGDLTLSAWIKITSDSNAHYIIGKGSGNDYNQMWYIRVDAKRHPSFILGNVGNTSASYFSSPEKINFDKNYHILATISGNTVSLYVDGIKKNEGNIESRIQTSGSVRIGRRIDGFAPFNGSIERPQIWNRALSADEVKLLYESYNPCLMIVKGGIG